MNRLQLWNRRAAGLARRTLFGRDLNDLDEKSRFPTYQAAMWYLNFECVPGDILEFGVCQGISLMMLTHAYAPYRQFGSRRRIVGFDSFEGLEEDREGHARFTKGLCREPGANRADVLRRFAQYGLDRPTLEVGPFRATLPRVLGTTYVEAAIVHIDCDLYEPTLEVLHHVEPILSDGAMVLFDDWFCYRGNPRKGQSRAFSEFLTAAPHWEAVPYAHYGVLAKAFLMNRR